MTFRTADLPTLTRGSTEATAQARKVEWPDRICTVLAIDPGDRESAYVCYSPCTKELGKFGKCSNDALLEVLDQTDEGGPFGFNPPRTTVIEMIASYGMPVGREIFETCVWIGRFMEKTETHDLALVYRKSVKLHLCGTTKAKDSNVRQALIDRFGPGRERAIGRKGNPGPLYGVTKDVWQALALAVAWADGVRAVEARP